MNFNEFKAWFEGFTDGIDSNPTEKQWEKIKARVAEIKTEPTPPVVIREYWNNYRRYWNEPYWYGQFQPYAISGMRAATVNNAQLSAVGGQGAKINFETFAANAIADDGERSVWADTAPLMLDTFRAMGAADAASLNGGK